MMYSTLFNAKEKITIQYLVFFAIIFMFITYSYCFRPTQTEYKVSADLENAILAENWPKVVELLFDVTPKTPSPVARLIKGHACLATNRNNESLCLFMSVYFQDSLQTKTYLKKWHDWTLAFQEDHENNPISYYFTGDALVRLGETEKAINIFTKGLSLKPKHHLILNARGVAYLAIENWINSNIDFLYAIEADSNFADSYSNSGFRLIARKEGSKGAIEFFTKALNHSPDFALALHGRGCVKLLQRKVDEALADFEKSSEKICIAPLFLKNTLKVQSFLGGLDENEMIAMVSGDTAGTYLDVKFRNKQNKYQNMVNKFNTFMNNPSENNVKEFIKTARWANPEDQARFKTTAERILNNNPGQRDIWQKYIDKGLDWNASDGPARRYSNILEKTMTAVGSTAGAISSPGNPYATIGGGFVGGALGGTARIKMDKQTSDMERTFKTFELSNKYSQSGGVDLGINKNLWEDGDWPFVPYFGLNYRSID